MRNYTTLKGEEFDLDSLPEEQSKLWEKAEGYFQTSPEWTDFSTFWVRKVAKTFEGLERNEIVKMPIFKLCQDLESRLGIEQGYTREADYRDALRELIEENFPSRYAFCKAAGVNEAFLSHILRKDKNFSITTLQEVMDRVGYEMQITFEKKVTGSTLKAFPPNSSVGATASGL